MKLYEINPLILDLLSEDVYDVETGEILDEDKWDEIKALELERDEKIENLTLFVKDLLKDSDALDVEIKVLNERKQQKKRKADRIKAYIDYALTDAGMSKFETARCKLGYRKSKQVHVDISPENLPIEYQNIKTTIAADKMKLKQAITEGKTIDGVGIVEINNLQIK